MDQSIDHEITVSSLWNYYRKVKKICKYHCRIIASRVKHISVGHNRETWLIRNKLYIWIYWVRKQWQQNMVRTWPKVQALTETHFVAITAHHILSWNSKGVFLERPWEVMMPSLITLLVCYGTTFFIIFQPVSLTMDKVMRFSRT